MLRRRGVQAGVAGWVGLNVLVLALADGHLPFHAPALADPSTVEAVLGANVMLVEVFVLMGVVHLLTRRRQVPDIAARAPERATALRETLLVLGYGALALLGGYLVGRALGWPAFGLHLDGMVFHNDHEVAPGEVLCWAAYNGVVYAVVPLLVFRRRYSTVQLGLRSTDRRGDLRVILVVLALEASVQLSLASSSILDLGPRQILLGAPLTLALGLAGTALPAMVFVYCILTPRYLRLTGSVPATVILGGLTYALLHCFDGWMSFSSGRDAVLSVAFLLLTYTGPGMFKTFLTVRTANAWTHVWAYHAVAPHTLVDTPMFVRVFGIR